VFTTVIASFFLNREDAKDAKEEEEKENFRVIAALIIFLNRRDAEGAERELRRGYFKG
jgi:hypothetical protein